MVSSDIWTIALLPNGRGADFTRRIISASSHLSDVYFSETKKQEKKGGSKSAFRMDTGLAYAHGDIMASSVGVPRTTRSHRELWRLHELSRVGAYSWVSVPVKRYH